jgi:Domain of unknown function (DUF4296)
MHKYIKLFFFVLIFLAACRGNKTPTGILDKERMTNLLTEIHLVDASMYSLYQVPDTLYKYGTGKYLAVFKKYHTDSVQFKKSFKYYSLKPDALSDIYEQITNNLKHKSDSLNKINLEQIKKRADSLNKLPKKATPVAPAATPQPLKPAPKQYNYQQMKLRPKKHVDSIK